MECERSGFKSTDKKFEGFLPTIQQICTGEITAGEDSSMAGDAE